MRRKTKWCALALTCGVALSAAGLAVSQVKANAEKEFLPTLTSKMQGDTLVLLNDEVAEFALNYTKGSAIHYAPADGIATDRYVPKPATISWENNRDDALYYTLRVGLEQDLSDAENYIVSETTADVDYLYSAKHYYYQVYAHYDNDEVVKSRVFDFYTADVPRTVYIEGVTNTRDIGGRYIMGGQYQIKQGMVYRGAEVNRELGAITEEGKRVMLYDLGIKTDLDIRGGDVQNATGTSPINDELNYVHLEAPWYSHVFNASYKEAFTQEIRTFANPDNYPIYLHCSVGRDRAGTLSALLSALIGVEEIDIYRDYEMSFLSRVGLKDAAQSQGNHSSLMYDLTVTIDRIKNEYPADTLMESTAEWMKDYLGITQEEIDTIRNTLWEEAGVRVDNSAVKRAVQPRKSVSKVNTARDFLCTYSANPDEAVGGYGSSAVNAYTAEEAAAAGIPAGYEGTVLEVIPKSGVLCGAALDFSGENVPSGLISALEFRVYIGYSDKNTGNYPQVRIQDPNGSSAWVYQVNKANAMGEWITVTMPATSGFSMLYKDGKLNKFELSLRTNAKVPFYIDSAKYVLKADDGKAPVITYTGLDSITVALGAGLDLPVSATDNMEGDVAVEYVWGDGVTLNEKGTPAKAGAYTLTLKATDFYGNTATKQIAVMVTDGVDTVAPVIDWKASTVKAAVGTKPMMKVNAADNSGLVTVTKTWSNGALDKCNKLTAGTHTWTVTASDASGNKSTKSVTFIVTENEPAYTTMVDEANAAGYFTVTFDGENPMIVPYGVKVDKPMAPVKADTAEMQYTFLGWYVGDEKWDFDNVVTSNLDIQSKWLEVKQSYKVSFDGKVAVNKVEYGSVIPANLIPETPTKPASSREQYTFAGWYNGDELWNLETDVVTGNTVLVSKFTKSPRLYTVTFDGENATEYGYGSKIEKPADPVKESTETTAYEFIGWYYLGKEWNFDTDIVNYDIKLQSKWNEIAIEVEKPDDTQSDSELDSDTDSEQNSSNNDTAQPGVSDLIAGCSGVIGGVASGLTALGVAAYVLLKKKED